MTEKDQSTLRDVFQSMSPDQYVQQTTHMLQFLWRDLTSSFDIVGPFLVVLKPCQQNLFWLVL